MLFGKYSHVLDFGVHLLIIFFCFVVSPFSDHSLLFFVLYFALTEFPFPDADHFIEKYLHRGQNIRYEVGEILRPKGYIREYFIFHALEYAPFLILLTGDPFIGLSYILHLVWDTIVWNHEWLYPSIIYRMIKSFEAPCRKRFVWVIFNSLPDGSCKS